MNVLFIDPYLSEIECNVGLGYLCAVLKTHGHHCRVIACAEGFCKVSGIIQEVQPDIIGFSIKSSTISRTVEAALEVRKFHDGLIICGGPHITIDGKAFLSEHSCFDIGVAGEGEDTILEIIDHLLGNRKLDEIKGIIARIGEGLLCTEPREPVDNLDKIPFPDYTGFDIYSNGMKVAASFIVGLPDSDYRSDMESIDFARRLNLDSAWFNLYCPFIKTEGYEMLLRNGEVRFLHDWKNAPLMFHNRKVYCIFETEDYPCEERIRAFMKGNLQLFNYDFIRDYSVPSWSPERLFPLFALIAKYDRMNILRHISRMTREMFSLAMKLLRRQSG